jgi:hypothetical protein
MDYKIAMAAGQDAGDRSMHDAGRLAWNEDDWNVAADIAAQLIALFAAAEGQE